MFSISQMREVIAMEVFHILQEELPTFVDWITDKVVSRLEEHIASTQFVGGAANGMPAGGDLVVRTQLGKRKRTLL